VPVYMLHITSATMLSNLRQKPRGRREEEEAKESLFRGQRRERGGPRARPRYPGVEDLFGRATGGGGGGGGNVYSKLTQ